MGPIHLMLAMALMTLATDSYAQAEVCEPSVSVRRRVLEIEGQEGIWFHAKIAKCILRDLHELHALRAKLSTHESHLRWLNNYLSAAKSSFETVSSQLKESQRDLRRANGWWRSPALWFVLGAVVSGVAVGLALGFGR